MPIDESTWNEATEQDSTAAQITEFLRENESEAYTTNELVTEIVPEETDDESVVAYYRAVLELLARNGSVEKRNVSVDADETDSIPYFRAVDEPEIPAAERTPTTEQTQPATREVPLDRPIRVRMAEDSGPIPVRVEGESRPATNSDAPFFVRWYRWYSGKKRRATLKNDPSNE